MLSAPVGVVAALAGLGTTLGGRVQRRTMRFKHTRPCHPWHFAPSANSIRKIDHLAAIDRDERAEHRFGNGTTEKTDGPIRQYDMAAFFKQTANSGQRPLVIED